MLLARTILQIPQCPAKYKGDNKGDRGLYFVSKMLMTQQSLLMITKQTSTEFVEGVQGALEVGAPVSQFITIILQSIDYVFISAYKIGILNENKNKTYF